ncbi:hypothetical protein [Aliivibrio sifiae]|uniref:Uncharacterized protein n=1 Tax=Aliivibrio sifiae TaxID=566293 RepID=A0A2S7X2T2_9GAMM|nr:hypothetical protein [Aliivibrio sifiae]PQJ84534.1 hypothetical protein BTO22_13515 [Aliivibrio sifiae]
MAVFYTVDRSGSLSEGLTIDLYNENESFVYNCNIGGCSKPFSLSGLSSHGWYNYRNHSTQSGQYEFNLECIRRVFYPNKPSRLQSMFAWGHFNHAVNFIHQKNYFPESGVFYIFEFEATNFHKGDMSFCSPQYQGLMDSRFKQYWAGDFDLSSQSEHQYEFLIPLPIAIRRLVLIYHKFEIKNFISCE